MSDQISEINIDISLSVNSLDFLSSTRTGSNTPSGYFAVGTTHNGEAIICIFTLSGRDPHERIFFHFSTFLARSHESRFTSIPICDFAFEETTKSSH